MVVFWNVPGLVSFGGLQRTLALFVRAAFPFAFLLCFPSLLPSSCFWERAERRLMHLSWTGYIKGSEFYWHPNQLWQRAASGEAFVGSLLFSPRWCWWHCWESLGNESWLMCLGWNMAARVLWFWPQPFYKCMLAHSHTTSAHWWGMLIVKYCVLGFIRPVTINM